MTDADIDQITRATILSLMDALTQFAIDAETLSPDDADGQFRERFGAISPAEAHRLADAAIQIGQPETATTLRVFAEVQAAKIRQSMAALRRLAEAEPLVSIFGGLP